MSVCVCVFVRLWVWMQVAATVALFKLCRGRQLYRMMPSLFRDLWLEWEKQELDGKSKGYHKEACELQLSLTHTHTHTHT